MSFGGFGTFGSTPQTAPGASEPPKPTTNIFGQSTTASVGAPNTQPAANTNSPFGGFGAAQQQQAQAGGLSNVFGAASSGSAPSALNTTPAPSTFGAQGSAPAINLLNPNGSTTTPLFPPGGTFSNSTAPPSNTTSGLFPPAPGAPFAGVGANTTSSPFGTGQPQATANPSAFKPFSNSTAAGFGGAAHATGAFYQSTSNTNPFGSSTFTLDPGLGQTTSTNPNTVEAQIQAIEAAMTPGLSSNRFQYYFYNLVDANQIHLYGRPPNATNEALWQRANRENPNPSRLVPALAVGFEDLKKRADAQQSQIDGQLAAVRLLRREVDKLSTKHTLTILPLARKLSHSHAQLAARLTALIHHLHLFIPSLRGASLRPEEEALRAKLEALEEDVSGRSDALGRAGGRMAELWGVVGRVKAQKEAGLLHGIGEGGGWAVVDPAAFEEIKTILINEQQGLKYLTDVLRTALRDVDLVRSGFGT